MTTTDSVDKRGHLYPNGSRRFVHAAIVAGFMATFMFSDNVFGDEPPEAGSVADADLRDAIAARNAGDLKAARERLLASFRSRPRPQIAAKLAQTEFELGYYREAAEHLTYYLQQKEPNASDRAMAAEMLAKATSKIGRLEVHVNEPGAEILVDGAVVGTSPLSTAVFVEPGKWIVEARKAGCVFKTVSVELLPGSTKTVSFTCTPPPPIITESDRGMPSWKKWSIPIAVGVGAVGLGFGIVRQVQANDLSQRANTRLTELMKTTPTSMVTCGSGSPAINQEGCSNVLSTLKDKDRTANLATAGFVVAGVGAVGAVVMGLWPTPSRHTVQVVPVVKTTESGVLIVGFF